MTPVPASGTQPYVSTTVPPVPVEQDRTQQYLEIIRDYILFYANNNLLRLQRFKEDQIEEVNLDEIGDFRLFNCFFRAYNAFIDDDRFTEQELNVFRLRGDEDHPRKYFLRVSSAILENPNNFSQNALHSFFILYLNFFDLLQHERSCCGCVIL